MQKTKSHNMINFEKEQSPLAIVKLSLGKVRSDEGQWGVMT